MEQPPTDWLVCLLYRRELRRKNETENVKGERVALREQGLRLYINTIGYNRKYRGRPRERRCVALKSGDRDLYQLFVLSSLSRLFPPCISVRTNHGEMIIPRITHRLPADLSPLNLHAESTTCTREEPVNWIISIRKFDTS